MAQVVMQHLQLNCPPQPTPRTAIDAVNEASPQLRKVNGREVISPGASIPEMRFKVLEGDRIPELNRLRNSHSHLALGVFYARVGMICSSQDMILQTAVSDHKPLSCQMRAARAAIHPRCFLCFSGDTGYQ